MHYNLDKDAAFCYTCVSAEVKRLKTICHNKDKAFITRGYRSWCHATENIRMQEECGCHKNYIKIGK